MPTTEHTINDALADVLRTTRRVWQPPDVVSSENTGTIKGSTKRPDILVVEANVSPVVVETEVLPAVTVEQEAIERLGEQLARTGRTILSSVAVRLPASLRKRQGSQALQKAIRECSDLEMALYTGDGTGEPSRMPESGWIRGDVRDLSLIVQFASVPPAIIERAANILMEGVSDASEILAEVVKSNPAALQRIAEEMRQENGQQTRRMAMAIVANAFVFHEGVARGAGALGEVKSLEELRGSAGGLTKPAILAEWRKILAVNYWPIFDIARRILELIPPAFSQVIIDRMANTAAVLVQNRLMRSHDLTGTVFQRLIIDRKFLAAFYTTPASAALLVGLAITSECPPKEVSWANADDVRKLRIADFACGTGTLLSTAYQRVGQLHELAGGDADALHPAMMAKGLVGCDVLPAAAHLTASMLAGSHPTITYENSSIFTVSYGKQEDGDVALGSLELLDPLGKLGYISVTASAADAKGESRHDYWTLLPHGSFDYVIMNPPFTRPTGHEAEKIGVPNPMFAAFGSTEEEQRLMGKATAALAKGSCYHGNAGEASLFLDLADRKLRVGGTLALVMPLSLLAGDAWEKSRERLAKNYVDLVAVSIAGALERDASFSADTDIAECLLIGRKSADRRKSPVISSRRATFVVLSERPAYPLAGVQAARQIRSLIDGKSLRRLEDGPLGGTPISFGDDIIGHVLDAPIPATEGWYLARIADLSLAQAAYQLASKRKLWLPGMAQKEIADVPMATIGDIGTIGPYHADINGKTSTGGIRGPFTIVPLTARHTPTYPALWAHNAERERMMEFDGDSEAVPIKSKNAGDKELIARKVEAIQESASHAHLNRDFRFNSQSTAMQYTPRRTIGGRAWTSVRLKNADQEKALVLWANSTLGLLMYWWHANKQQSGRGSIGVNAAATLPTLDVTKLSDKQLSRAVAAFDAMRVAALAPFNEIDSDANRRKIDDLVCGALGLDKKLSEPGGALELVRLKLSKEPSVYGAKEPD